MEEKDTEREKVIAYLMNFSLKAYHAIENEDASTFLGIIGTHADEIIAYKDGKPLPMSSSGHVRHKIGSWRLV